MDKRSQWNRWVATNSQLDQMYKARLVAKVFSQVEGIDYNETFTPVAKMNSIQLILALVATHKW